MENRIKDKIKELNQYLEELRSILPPTLKESQKFEARKGGRFSFYSD